MCLNHPKTIPTTNLWGKKNVFQGIGTWFQKDWGPLV